MADVIYVVRGPTSSRTELCETSPQYLVLELWLGECSVVLCSEANDMHECLHVHTYLYMCEYEYTYLFCYTYIYGVPGPFFLGLAWAPGWSRQLPEVLARRDTAKGSREAEVSPSDDRKV